MLLSIHVAAGGLALVLGTVALMTKKGRTVHRRSGRLFVCAMLVMGASASILGFRKSPTDGNVVAGLMTAYFVGTALTTVRPVTPWTRRTNAVALTVVVCLALGTVTRHLWRMCLALFIAAGSFLSFRERVATLLPEPFTTAPMRALPILLLFSAMFYWLWRVRRRGRPGMLPRAA